MSDPLPKRQRTADAAPPAVAAAPLAAAPAANACAATTTTSAAAPPSPPHAAAPASAAAHSPAATAAAPATSAPRVVVWDLDETLIVFNSLLDRSFTPVDCAATQRVSRPRILPAVEELRALAAERERLARGWESLVLSVCDNTFFFTQLESCDETALDDLAADDDGASLSGHDFSADALAAHTAGSRAGGAAPPPPQPLCPQERRRLTAYRLRAARERYVAGAAAALACPGAEAGAAASWERLYKDTDAFAQRWLSAGRDAVAAAAAAGCTNVLVTAGCLLPTLAKLLLFRLDGLFGADVIFSARRDGKAACFARIAARYGAGATFCAVGDGAEEAAAARAMRWPLVPIAPLALNGALPPHALTAELLLRRLADCAPTPTRSAAEGDAAVEASSSGAACETAAR